MFTRLANDIKQQKNLAYAFSNRRTYYQYQLTIFVLLDNCTSNKKLNDPFPNIKDLKIHCA